MVAKGHVISAAARAALQAHAAYAGPRVTITKHLEPKVWDEVALILRTLGGVFIARRSAFELESGRDACATVTAALEAGRVLSAANADGFVATPTDLAIDYVLPTARTALVHRRPTRVLEPSAGTGNLVRAILEEFGDERFELTAVEPDHRRASQIPSDHRVEVVVETFETYSDQAQRDGAQFDVVVMNPPFAVPGRSTIWVDHLLAAWDLLAPGGCLVAIVPASCLDPERGGPTRKAHKLVWLHGDGTPLEPDAFAESGITFLTAVIALDRLPPHPAARPFRRTGHPAQFRSYRGDEDALAVRRPYVSREAALRVPVQRMRDFSGLERVARYRADCLICTRPVWTFDDGDDDTRSILGRNGGAESLFPRSYGAPDGPRVARCVECSDDGELYRRALTLMHDIGKPAPGQLALEL